MKAEAGMKVETQPVQDQMMLSARWASRWFAKSAEFGAEMYDFVIDEHELLETEAWLEDSDYGMDDFDIELLLVNE